MSLNHLVSKVLAGGLAAGIFLFWWPTHLPATGGEWLVLRGLAWALAYEILMLSFCPLENLATRSLPRRRHAADKARRVLVRCAPGREGRRRRPAGLAARSRGAAAPSADAATPTANG